MKIKLFQACLAAACAVPAIASAQVSISGILDIGPRIDAGTTGGSIKSIQSGQEYGSRLDFIGTDELGDGWKATFVLEAGITLDDGAGSANPPGASSGLNFGRTSAISIGSDKTGYISLGRQYTPLWALSASGSNDPFVGSWLGGNNVVYSNTVIVSNAIVYSYGYTSRTMLLAAPRQGFGTAILYALGEAATPSKAGQQMGFNVSYGAGPWFFGYAYYQSYGSSLTESVTAPITDTPKLRQQTASTAYDFGFARLHLGVNSGRNDAPGTARLDRRSWTVGLSIPFLDLHTLRVMYGRANDRTATNADWSTLQLGYTYDFSKRTAFYLAYGGVDNNANAAVAMARALGTYAKGSSPKSYAAGIRHYF
jgi:GBP family porin